MCASCGCGNVDDDHGDRRNITLKSLKIAAAANGITLEKVIKNLEEAAVAESSVMVVPHHVTY
jgi:hypothetical protein